MSDETEIKPKLTDAQRVFKKLESYKEDFNDVLEKIQYASDETKLLWQQIYENALNDRTNAYLLYTDLYQNVLNQAQGHLNFGQLMTKYLERMNKSNDQLLKLAELVDKAVEQQENIDIDALYRENQQAEDEGASFTK